jgi:hypothetical protein
MNIENLAIENQQTLSGDQAENSTSQQTTEIRPLPLESFKLVGGGSSVVLLG